MQRLFDSLVHSHPNSLPTPYSIFELRVDTAATFGVGCSSVQTVQPTQHVRKHLRRFMGSTVHLGKAHLNRRIVAAAFAALHNLFRPLLPVPTQKRIYLRTNLSIAHVLQTYAFEEASTAHPSYQPTAFVRALILSILLGPFHSVLLRIVRCVGYDTMSPLIFIH